MQDYYRTGIVPAIDGGVVKSDVLVPGILLRGVQKVTTALRRDNSKHSGSKHDTISNVVDPYLYAFSWEKSRFIPFGRPPTLSKCLESWEGGYSSFMQKFQPPEDHCVEQRHYRYANDMAWSRRFQWAPFEVEFDGPGDGRCKYVCSHTKREELLTVHVGSQDR